MTATATSVKGARDMLARFGFDNERSNERSAIVLLGLLGLAPGDSWANSTNTARGVTPLMEHARLWAPRGHRTRGRQSGDSR